MSNQKPTARIAVNRNVVPAGTNVYLKSGQEFEIELFNPTQHNVLAKIYINGEAVSDTGIIIKPGRREWLERYIDKPRKFKFDVYEVESNNNDVKAAIKNNGSIKVEFYKEKPKANNNYLILDGNWNKPYNPGPYSPTVQPYWFGMPSTCNQVYGNSSNTAYFTNTLGNSRTTIGTTANLNGTDVTLTSDNSSYTADFGLVNCNASLFDAKLELSLESNKSLEETGRIEEGSHSNQTFTYVDMDFETWTLTSVEYKLLPLSKKPVVASEVNVYCTSCGAKQKKTTWKFCPSCGSKFE